MMSHEFRTPLSTTLMFIDMILAMQTNAAAIKFIQLMKVTLNLLLSLVNDIVDLKLIKENSFTVNRNIFRPEKAFEFIMEIFMQNLERHNIQL